MSNDKTENCSGLFDIENWIPEFHIDDAKRAALCFRESLIICSKTESFVKTNPIGGYCILIESIGPYAEEFLIQVQSSMSIDGHFGGTKVISSATSKFHCLEEKRAEFMYEDNGLHEKGIYIGIEDDSYHVKITHTCPCHESIETKDLSFSFNISLISEGVNILLMRYLALVNYEGILSFESITIDGELTKSNYICIPSDQMEIDGHFLSVYTVERKIFKEDGTMHCIKSFLTPKGRILRHNWLDVPYVLKINPILDPNAAMKTIEIETPLRDRWTEDIEMFSKYLDMKACKTAESIEYLADHPEIKQLIADYTQTLLVGKQIPTWINIIPIILRKPKNVLEFTIQHFKAFATNPIAWETSTTETNSDVNVKSQLAREESEIVCDVCGFSIDSSLLKEAYSKSSMEESPEKASSHDSVQDNQSKDIKTTEFDAQGTADAQDTSISELYRSDMCIRKCCSMPASLLQLKRTCNQCQATVTTCHREGSQLMCPVCLKPFEMCTKCSTIDQMLQKLRITK